MYVITINGKTRRYPTFVSANKVANAIFDATGIVVGIERDEEAALPLHVAAEGLADAARNAVAAINTYGRHRNPILRVQVRDALEQVDTALADYERAIH